MSRRRNPGYRGRTWARSALYTGLCLLVLLLVLAAGALLVGQRYIVYSDDGIRLELPSFSRESSHPELGSVSVDVVHRPGT